MSRLTRGTVAMAILVGVAGCAASSHARGPVAFPRAPEAGPSGVERPAGEAVDPPSAPRPGEVVSGPVSAVSPDGGVAAAAAVAATETALSVVGVPYVFGGEDPATGVDCSGLVRFAFGAQHVDLPRTVAEQFLAGDAVPADRIREGDLLFFSTIGPGATHVGIALGAAAPGMFVHAPGTGQVVRTERYDTDYWRQRFLGARRVF
ncbi:MAG: C40 family peptidase [Vicinamibacterales bacterium]